MGRYSTHCEESIAVWVGKQFQLWFTTGTTGGMHEMIMRHDVHSSTSRRQLKDGASHTSSYGENMSFVFLLFLLTFPEPVWRFRGLNPRAAKRLFLLAGKGETGLVSVTRCLFLGERFLLGPPIIPLATTEMPVRSACQPACLRRGVARRMMFFITPPRPYPLW